MHVRTLLQKQLSTFRMGNQTVTVYFPNSLEHLRELIQEKIFINPNWMILGEGSNTVFVTDTIKHIIRYSAKKIILLKETKKYVSYKVDAGLNWEEFVQFTLSKHLWGAENLALIPGSVGASPVQNIGAYGSEIKDILESVEYIDLDSGKLVSLHQRNCKLGYRDSIFKQKLKNKVCIISVTMKLSKIPKPNLTYKILAEYLDERALPATLDTIYSAVCSIRKTKLADPVEIPNCGSFFKNPVIGENKRTLLLKSFPSCAIFTYLDSYKVSAAWCIDQCGLTGANHKGITILQSQPLVLTNSYDAKTSALLETISIITKAVEKKFGLKLETEVNLV